MAHNIRPCCMKQAATECYSVGALITQACLVQTVRKCLPPAWLKQGKNTCRYLPNGKASCAGSTKDVLMAIHLSPDACMELDAPPEKQQLPSKLANFLSSGEVKWMPGLRLGSRKCLGGTPDWQLHNMERKKKQQLQAVNSRKRKADEQSCHFTFSELFAGIGGQQCALLLACQLAQDFPLIIFYR